ncbi:GTP cyclohydrolase FolE2 [Alteromonas sp. 38]|uniref:GTP cyclohydrolase FolE2 n=1 Tax=Alteromonas TaxID=226 RepID=UPI0012F26493|nr:MULTISPECIES: GTP cyclohydrolase FolE2 [Alteromonas]CAD5253946.1 GTP cyclohydrolase FolE2 [Alteromonas sp. 154]VXB06581.1 GTP cyclohydrolase FolE2 [Alteromonas sp. 38]
MYQPETLPDITTHSIDHPIENLNWVGMEKVGLPVKLKLSSGDVIAASASVDIFVSLDTNVKGIHMSRLYLQLNEQLANQIITVERLAQLIASMLESHQGISHSAKVKLSFEAPLNKKALLSQNAGYQVYPIAITYQRIAEQSKHWLDLTIPYSSTCPCSAALATQLIADSIANRFPDENMKKAELLQWLSCAKPSLATPHNQRSYAYIKMCMSQSQLKSQIENLDKLIFQFEDVIGTPVQTAVKREDEQEFARLNGRNLMFCEDAARRVKGYLESLESITDYWFKVEHQESLHAHNAVVTDQKNIK